MSFGQREEYEQSAYLQLFMLVIFAVCGTILFTLLAFLFCFGMYGMDFFKNYDAFLHGDPRFLNGLKAFQIITTIGLFVVPPLFLSRFSGNKWTGFYKFKNPKLELLIFVVLLIICAMPLMEATAMLNQKMTLPGFLKPLEHWMREKEDEAMEMTIALLTVHNVWEIGVNMVMIAMLPAIGEELFFRGGIQQLSIRIFKNPHAGIWITAIIFSAIHVQFFGFFPRLFLGAAFGYLYYWSGSLWYTILAHFLNNAYAVCVAFYLQKHHMPLNSTEPTINVQWYGYLLSFVLTLALLKYFKNKTTQLDGKQLD